MITEHNTNLPQRSMPVTLAYNGQVIRDRREMLSLTDMWKAAGSPDGRGPSDWRSLPETARFVEFVADTGIAGFSGNELFKAVRGGKSPGTWAHWQIGLAYAKYLSPEFHMWCNEVVRERMEGRQAHHAEGLVTDFDRVAREQIGGIVKGILAKQLKDVLPVIVSLEDRVKQMLLGVDARVAALEYVSVRQLLSEAKAVQKKRNRLNRKVGRELRDRALLAGPPIPCRRCPHSGVWLFQRDFAAQYMVERGNTLVAAHNDQQNGQTVLRLVTGRGQ